MFDIILSGLIWVFVVYSVLGGYQRTRRLDRYSILTWTIFVSFALVFTLRIKAIQPWIDGYFHGYPVTFLASLVVVLVPITAYSFSLKWITERSPAIYPPQPYHAWLIYTAPFVSLGLMLLMVLHVLGRVSSFQIQYEMKWMVELYGLLQASLVFLPVNWRMFQHEQVFPMRAKHIATLVLSFTFAISAACSVVFIPLILFTGEVNPGPYVIPRAAISAICLIIILLPYRWLLYLQQIYRYVRLFDLERRIDRQLFLRHHARDWRHGLSPKRIENATYAILISIMDNYRLLNLKDKRNYQFFQQIRAIALSDPDYPIWVKEICRLKL